MVKIGGENYTPDGDYTLVYSGTNYSIWTTDSEGGTEPVIPGSDYRLISTADPGYGQAVYFTGTFDEGENWTKAIRGTYDGVQATILHKTMQSNYLRVFLRNQSLKIR